MRTHVDLFSGIGGFSLACEWAGVETIAFSENSYASRVLQRRFPGVRNYGDVRSVPAVESVWLVTAGVPCQPASIAGRRRGADDDRWLWPEAIAAVERIKPAWVCLENPLGILSLEQPLMSIDLEGYGNLIEEAIRREGDFWAAITGEVEFIFRDLVASVEKLGYEVAPVVVPACGVGALHRRYRVWIMGHATGIQPRPGQQPAGHNEIGSTGSRNVPNANGSGRRERRWGKSIRKEQYPAECFRQDAADANGGRAHAEPERVTKRDDQTNTSRHGEIRIVSVAGREGRKRRRLRGREETAQETLNLRPSNGGEAAWGERNQWSVEPDVGRVANGIPARADRLRGLGNAIVPQVAYQLIKRMIEAEEVL